MLPHHPPTTTCDLLVSDGATIPPHVVRNARELQRSFGPAKPRLTERELRQALLAGYPDRVAHRRAPGQPRVLLSSGHGGVVGPESGVREGDFLLALDVQAGRPGEQLEARVRIASVVEKAWLSPTSIEHVHELDDASGAVRAREREMYGALVLKEREVKADAAIMAQILADAYLARARSDEDQQLIERLRFARLDIDLQELALRAASGRRKLGEMHLADGLDWNAKQQLDEQAPATFTAPSGRSHPLDVPCRRIRRALDQAAGTVRSRRHAVHRSAPRTVTDPSARPQWTAGADDEGSAKLLGHDLPGSAEGAARTLSEASLA